MYEMLTGSIPSNELIQEWEEYHREPQGKKRPPFFTYGHNIDVPEGVLDIVEQALKQDPNERFQSIAEVLEKIKPIVSDSVNGLIELPPPPSDKRYMPRRDAVSENFIGGLLISLGLIGVAFLSWQTYKNNTPASTQPQASSIKRVDIKPDLQLLKTDSGVPSVKKSKIIKYTRKKHVPSSQPSMELSPAPSIKKNQTDSGSDVEPEEKSGDVDEGDTEAK